MLKIEVLTLFTGMFASVIGESIIKRARAKRLVKINIHDLRKWSKDRHKKVDDKPYGGGPGMILSCQPIYGAVKELKRRCGVRGAGCRVILLSPQGKRFDQKMANRLAKQRQLILICGHYEGVDERVKKIVTEEISIGDYVLTGGELPAMVIIDALTRLIPGVLGNKESAKHESFQDGFLEYPQYTRPMDYKGLRVPQILLSGDHERIEEWRNKNKRKIRGNKGR